ncbi:MAG: hypothetical protein LBO04_07170 [Spirochaetaceae bacterium]|jgi:hypothetical protein|nr:hypothetical protein [Spirochaetaceae bacterium]
MGEGIIKRLPGSLRAAGDRIPDVRRGGNVLRHRITDVLMCAFAVFFFLYPSLLRFQRAMKSLRRRNNMETLFGVSEIPCDNTIRELMDGIAPEALSRLFGTAPEADRLRAAETYRWLESVITGGLICL